MDVGRVMIRDRSWDGSINVLVVREALGIELLVNLRICFEVEWFGLWVAGLSFTIASRQVCMEERGSKGLDEVIQAEAGPGEYFDGVDCVYISDHYVKVGILVWYIITHVRGRF
jgi:Cys-Gly metallodipeptidase DUG1